MKLVYVTNATPELLVVPYLLEFGVSFGRYSMLERIRSTIFPSMLLIECEAFLFITSEYLCLKFCSKKLVHRVNFIIS